MITQPTCFILGAGASMPSGFPSGIKLIEEIIEGTNVGVGGRPFPHSTPLCRLLSSLDFNEIIVRKFHTALRHSGHSSIDAFLEYRTEFDAIGKSSIAYILLARESLASLFATENEAKHEAIIYEQCWYRHLFKSICTAPDDFKQNTLKILSFNYDRSLENFLFHAFKNAFGIEDSKCQAFVDHLEIVHLHGKVGNNAWEMANINPYPPNLKHPTPAITQRAAEMIKVVHQSQPDSQEFNRAREIIGQSEAICFLGFSYHPESLNRLGFKNINYRKKIQGTAFGMGQEEIRMVKNYFQGIQFRPFEGENNTSASHLEINLGGRDEHILTYLKSTRLGR